MEDFIQDIARRAGELTLQYFNKAEVQYTKSHALDVVTQADLASNKLIVGAIAEKFPNDGIISEESGESNTAADSIWIIDPLDGTLNFSKGIPMYMVMIAHATKGQVDLGAMYDPVHKELYYAKKGEGAFMNGKKVSCSTAPSVEEAVVVINSGMKQEHVDTLSKLLTTVGKSKMHVAAYYGIAVSAAHVSSGKRDVFMGKGAQIWDYAAPSVILSEAGCRVTNIQGGPWTLKDNNMLAANPALHEQILAAIK